MKIFLFRLSFIILGALIGGLCGGFGVLVCYLFKMNLSQLQDSIVVLGFGLFGLAAGLWTAFTFKAPQSS
jgi:hypothetical protein